MEFIRGLRDRVTAQWNRWQERWRARAENAGDFSLSRVSLGAIAIFVLLVIVYFPLGMFLYNRVDDDVSFQPGPEYAVVNGSKAVATATALVSREADHWIANKPWFHPAAMLDNGPNFQLGMMYAVSRFAMELGDYLGRQRGSSGIDPNLDRAAGLLRYDGRTWYWGQGNIIPKAKAETQYRQAAEALLNYNRNVAAGKATYDRRADNLIAFLDRVAADLGSAGTALETRTELGSGYFDASSDDVFYEVKGKLYGYYLLLRDLGEDFGAVIQQKGATSIWNKSIDSLKLGAEMDPLIIVNGRGDSMLVPSHLSALGFQLYQARTHIREIGDILQK